MHLLVILLYNKDKYFFSEKAFKLNKLWRSCIVILGALFGVSNMDFCNSSFDNRFCNMDFLFHGGIAILRNFHCACNLVIVVCI